jgi:hypothetical protein
MEDLKFKTAAQVMKHTNKEGIDPDFYTNKNKGYAMAINGYRISVQWGPGNYVDRDVRYGNDYDAPMLHWLTVVTVIRGLQLFKFTTLASTTKDNAIHKQKHG